jgi:hypothetical protein
MLMGVAVAVASKLGVEFTFDVVVCPSCLSVSMTVFVMVVELAAVMPPLSI